MDLQKIKEDVKKVIEYSQDIPNAKVDAIIDDWYKAKAKWLEYMDGEPIYEYPEEVRFELDRKAKLALIQNFVEKVENYYGNDDLGCFLASLSEEEFFNNITKYEINTFGIVVPANYKVIKAFKFFEENEDKLKEMQNEASMIIQQNVVSGRLCISVHPLDYLSLSENVHSWRSCHALDGDYRSGNMNYMMDNNTVVCYLRAEKQAILPHFPESVIWNSKKWRVLLFMSEDEKMIFMGRPYPFVSAVGINLIREKILPTIMPWAKWGNFHEPTYIATIVDHYSGEAIEIEPSQKVPIGGALLPLSYIIEDGNNTHHFNDLLHSTCYTPLYSQRYHPYNYSGGTNIDRTKFKIGKKCRCPSCGEKYIDFGEKMLCEDCD